MLNRTTYLNNFSVSIMQYGNIYETSLYDKYGRVLKRYDTTIINCAYSTMARLVSEVKSGAYNDALESTDIGAFFNYSHE